MTCFGYDTYVYHFWFASFCFLGYFSFFHSRIAGACPVTSYFDHAS